MRSLTCCVALVLISAVSSAQAELATSSAPAPKVTSQEESWEARVQYGIVSRSGALNDSGPGLTYNGITPNDVALRGWLWLLYDIGGLGLSVEREAFALYDNATRVTGGGLIRAHLGPTARLRLGPVRLEALVGYAFHQLPDFGNTNTTPSFSTITRHGLMLAARGLVDLGPVTIEARFEYPVALASINAAGLRSPMNGYTVGGGVRVAVARTGSLVWGAMVDASYSNDTAPASAAYQNLIRAGIALDLQWRREPTVVRTGTVTISVRSDDGIALGRAAITVETPSGQQAPSLDESGRAVLAEVLAGHISAHATLPGYDPVDGEVELSAGGESTLPLTMKKTPPTVGGLIITVVDKATKAPLADVNVRLGEALYTTNASGMVVVRELKGGPVTITFNADGYQPGNEAASVVAGVDSSLEVFLVSAKTREPATITGLVRNGRGGATLQANLDIPEANIRAKANAAGAFTFKLVGGTYTVTISSKGFQSQTKQLVVKDGEQAILNVDLQPK